MHMTKVNVPIVTGVDNRSHSTRVNGCQFVLAVARVASALFAPTPCASVTVCDHPTPCASVTVCDAYNAYLVAAGHLQPIQYISYASASSGRRAAAWRQLRSSAIPR